MISTSIRAAWTVALVIALAHGPVGGASARAVTASREAEVAVPLVGAPAAISRKLALGMAMIPWDAGALDDFTASVDGHVPALWAIWNDWGGSNPAFPTGLAQQVADRGAVPLIWWQPVTTGNLNDDTFTNQLIINGDFDTYIRQWASDAKSYGGPVVIRFAHEMDGNWFPWGVGRNGNTASNFITAWRHIWNIFRGPDGQGATNVRFLWSPHIPTASVYPGGQYVDYVGFTALNWAAAHGDPWRSMNTVLSGLVAGSRQFNKPIIVAELGSNSVGRSKATWIRNGYPAAYANFPEIVALVYFNVDTSPGQPDWRLTTPADALTAYREILAKPEFQGRFSVPSPDADTTPPTVGSPAATLLAAQKMTPLGQAWLRISWPAATDDGGVVAYELQHRVNAKAWTPVPLASPTALSADRAAKPGKSHTFRVRARDAAGNWSPWVESAMTPLVIFQEQSAALVYTGAFRRVGVAGASGGFVRQTPVAGQTVSMPFTGSSVAWVSAMDRTRGVAEIWLDGAKVATLDLYAPALKSAQVVWAAPVGPGTHVVEVRVTGLKNPAATKTRIDVDAFLVFH